MKNLFGEEVQIFMIGIKPSEESIVEKVNPIVAARHGVCSNLECDQIDHRLHCEIDREGDPGKDDRRPDPDRPTRRGAGEKRAS